MEGKYFPSSGREKDVEKSCELWKVLGEFMELEYHNPPNILQEWISYKNTKGIDLFLKFTLPIYLFIPQTIKISFDTITYHGISAGKRYEPIFFYKQDTNGKYPGNVEVAELDINRIKWIKVREYQNMGIHRVFIEIEYDWDDPK